MRFSRLTLYFLILLYVVALIRTAWVCDDAYITFRTVDNFIHGFGLTWNPDERVQAYTHPLWMLLVSGVYAITSEIYYTSILLSIAISLSAVVIFAFRIAKTDYNAITGVLFLIFSQAFVDYSTSGLENSLTHLILALFFLVYLKVEPGGRKLFLLSLTASLGMVNRFDTILIFLPIILALIFEEGAKKSYSALLGFLPFILWECFSLIYYGFPFPNTAYAKFSGYVSTGYLVRHGFFYLWDSFTRDPVTLVLITVAISLSLLRKQKALFPLICSIILYTLYIIRIGGDFMSGRFVTPPFFCSLIALSQIDLRKLPPAIVIPAIFAFCLYKQPPFLSGSSYGVGYRASHDNIHHGGIVDSRALHYPSSGLMRARFQNPLAADESVRMGKKLRSDSVSIFVARGIGYVGFYAGPSVHIVDLNALADPLLARLPPISETPRVAHFVRQVPQGYLATLTSGKNKIEDVNLALYYEKLSMITRGPLLNESRLLEICKMNLGHEDYLLENYITLGKLHREQAPLQSANLSE